MLARHIVIWNISFVPPTDFYMHAALSPSFSRDQHEDTGGMSLVNMSEPEFI